MSRFGVHLRPVHWPRTKTAALSICAGSLCFLGPQRARAQEIAPTAPNETVAASPPDSTQNSAPAAPSPAGVTPRAPVAAPLPPATVSPTQPSPVLASPAAAPAAATTSGLPANWTAGWHDDVFFIREPSDNFRVYLQGRANIDAYVPFGAGLSGLSAGNALNSSVFLRRVRPEIAGEFLRVFQFKIEGDWGQSTSDNGNAQAAALNCTVDAKTGEQTCNPRTSTVQSPTQRPSSLDVYINFAQSKLFNVQVGQFKIPFSLENRTSENFTPFLEASLPIRNLAAPLNRDIGGMIWGETGGREFYYSVGAFNGDGPNRMNPDSRFDTVARVFFHPLVHATPRLADWQIGASVRLGSRNPRLVGYDVPGMSTQGGFVFWKPTFSEPGTNRLLHIMPSGAQRSFAVETYLPIDPVELMGELVYIDNHTREAADGYQLSGFNERAGRLHGTGFYAQAGVWLLGSRGLLSKPGYSSPTRLNLDKPNQPMGRGLQLIGKFERIQVEYEGGSRSGTPSPQDGKITVNSFAFGTNLWLTRHVRLSANYALYDFPGSAPVSPSPADGPKQSSAQRAIGPAQTLAKGVDDDARSNAHVLHELMFRFGVAL